MSTHPVTTSALARPIDFYVEMGKDAMRQSKAQRTRNAYASDWRLFTRWCLTHNVSPLPAKVETVVAYLGNLANLKRRTTTMGRHLVSISLAHKTAGFEQPPTASIAVKETLKGLRRILGVQRTKKAPLKRDDLKRIFSIMDDPTHPLSVRDRALLLVGFAGGFRRSELAALNLEDVRFTDEGMVVTVRRSKTDQEGAGRDVAICHGGKLCPVKALRGWLSLAKISQGSIFRVVHWRGPVSPDAISGETVSRIVKKYVGQVGKDAKQFGGHSLRRGFCTAAAAAGATELMIMATTGHKSSSMVREYIAAATMFENNASALLGL